MVDNGYSNYKLAKLLDISQSTVAYWLDGKGQPQRSKKKQLAELFGVSVEYLMGNEAKNPATDNGDGDKRNAKREEINRLLDAAPDWLQEQIHSLLKAEESGRTSQGGDPKAR